MAISIAFRSAVYQTTNTAATVTGTTAWTPAANSLILCYVVSAYSASPVDATGVTGHGLTYKKLNASQSLSSTHQASVWIAKAGASPTSVAPVASLTTTNGTGDLLIEFEVTGYDKQGLFDPVGAVYEALVTPNGTANSGTGTAATVTLASPSNTNNRALGFVTHLSATSPTSGTWTITAGASGNFATPSTGAAGLFTLASFNTAFAATTAAVAWVARAFEIRAAGRINYVVYLATGATPTTTQVLAGQDATGSAALASGSDETPTTTQAYTFSAAVTGLTLGTAYKIAYVWSRGAWSSPAATEGSFTTTGGNTLMGQACL